MFLKFQSLSLAIFGNSGTCKFNGGRPHGKVQPEKTFSRDRNEKAVFLFKVKKKTTFNKLIELAL